MPHDTQAHSAYDVLILGAGLSGICSLHYIRERFPSWSVKAIEAGESVGGTWYWNRYPGARFDTESVTYQFSFDKDILDQWHWKEAYSPQTEILKYLEYVAEQKDLNKDIKFNTRIKSAHWQAGERIWRFVDEEGNQYKTRFFISCLGILSAPTLPAIPGIDAFEGEAFHSSQWPRCFEMSRDFADKRIGVIGTGATGIQIITALSKEPSIKSLHVFQRTANWCAPLRNTKVTVEQMAVIRASYAEMFELCAATPMSLIHQADPRKSSEVTDEERLALWEKVYAEPGFGKWLGAFSDTYSDRQANELYSAFMAKKIRDRVHDPKIADSLVPKNHGFGTRRVPLDSGYFEAYNKPNVHLVDLQKTPIDLITAKGVKTSDGKEHELDVLIFATGFDAITGAFSAIDWHAKDDRPLLGNGNTPEGQKAIWQDHRPHTYLGLTAPAMPNMFMVLDPHQPIGNATRSIEHAVEVITELLAYCKDNDYTFVEPSQEAVDEWTDHVVECGNGLLMNKVDSWMTGVNKKVKGKTQRHVARYLGSAVAFRKRCEDCRLAGWKGLNFA